MRYNRTVVSFFAFVLFMLGSTSSWAQTDKPNTFGTFAECKAAMASGNFRFYEPRFFGLNGKNPVNGKDRIVVPLETDLCFEMRVVGGYRFVAQREGTEFRGQKQSDGSVSLYARNDCGNEVRGVIFPAPSQPVTPTRTTESVTLVPPPPQTFAQAVANVTINLPTPPPQESRSVVETSSKKKGGRCSSWTCKGLVIAGGVGGYLIVARQKCWFPYGYSLKRQ